jgi:hypothetical protein
MRKPQGSKEISLQMQLLPKIRYTMLVLSVLLIIKTGQIEETT